MRSVSPSLQAKLDRRASTFCACWRLARRDGVVMGFTDHDRDLEFNATLFRADAGLSATEFESGVGLAPATGEAAGALRADGLNEADLLNGLYDGASVEIWLVDWSDASDRLLLDIGTIGEVRRGDLVFSAELRSGAHYFDQPQGRAFQHACSADLGDGRCGVDLAAADFKTTGAVVSFEGGVLTADLANGFDTGFFAGGALTFVGGANAGARFTVKSHRQEGARASLALWTPPARAPLAGDGFGLVAGCDKSAATCRTKFANIVNFRGFPHMPGNDRVIAYPGSLAPAMDGGSLFR